MSVEPKRGCGYRKEGGLYLVGGAIMEPCDRLPIPLEVCLCCGAGIKHTRGYTWIQPYKLLDGDHEAFIRDDNQNKQYDCTCEHCPVCWPRDIFGEDGFAGLLWIGKQFYKTPKDFLDEGADLGISRRIQTIPRGFEIGKTWIFFAHQEAIQRPATVPADADISKPHSGLFDGLDGPLEFVPGIFSAFKPSRIERIVKQSEYDLFQAAMHDWNKEPSQSYDVRKWVAIDYDESQAEIILRLLRDTDRGITLFPVPDNDPDHCDE